jgi:hypothetical protein
MESSQPEPPQPTEVPVRAKGFSEMFPPFAVVAAVLAVVSLTISIFPFLLGNAAGSAGSFMDLAKLMIGALVGSVGARSSAAMTLTAGRRRFFDLVPPLTFLSATLALICLAFAIFPALLGNAANSAQSFMDLAKIFAGAVVGGIGANGSRSPAAAAEPITVAKIAVDSAV